MRYYPAIFEAYDGQIRVSFPDFPGVSGLAKDDYAAAVVAKRLLADTMNDYVSRCVQVTEPNNQDTIEVHEGEKVMLVPAPDNIGSERPYHDDRDNPQLSFFHLMLQRIGRQEWYPVIDENDGMLLDDEAPDDIKDCAING
jgi:hypothetical protein